MMLGMDWVQKELENQEDTQEQSELLPSGNVFSPVLISKSVLFFPNCAYGVSEPGQGADGLFREGGLQNLFCICKA